MIKSLRFQKTYNLSKAQLIGQGNFAQVYKIFEQSLSKPIAIRKVLKSPQDLIDIQKEKQINEQLRKCPSPYILEIFEIIDGETCIYYLSEYCAGESLWQICQQYRHALNSTKSHKFSQLQSLHCILHIARGIQQLHNQRITHRDLKPQNILLTSRYSPNKPLPSLKIADFGLSTKNLIMQTVAGTKQYIAPQQAKFHTYTNAVDVWSLGIIFDELLHGEPFYMGVDNREVFEKIIKVEYRVRDEGVSVRVKELLEKIVRKRAYERPIIAKIIGEIEEILKQRQEGDKEVKKEDIRGRSLMTTKQSKILNNIQNKYRNSRHQFPSSTEPLQQPKIPLFKPERKKPVSQPLKKKPTLSNQQYLTPSDLIYEIFHQKQNLLSTSPLTVQKLPQFNPILKLQPIDIGENPLLPNFIERKKQFEYLNEMRGEDQEYERKLKETDRVLKKCRDEIGEREREHRAKLKERVIEQIEGQLEQWLDRIIL